MSKAIDIYSYVIEKAEHEPIETRIQLYRALADLAWDEELQHRLLNLADSLSLIGDEVRQLRLNLRGSTSGHIDS